MQISRQKINNQIDAVFGSLPRDGSLETTIWHKRGKEEIYLFDKMASLTPHVCLDGPTGSGKTSLARTVLGKLQKEHVFVQLVNDMNWQDFCVELTRGNKSKNSTSNKIKIKLKMDNSKNLKGSELINPFAFASRFSISLGDKKEEEEEIKEAAKTWSIQDVAQMLSEKELYIVIDDFEKASIKLTKSIADLCKILTGQLPGKAIIIGTGDIFNSLYKCDESLDGRLEEITLASFGSSKDVWHYLSDGFEKLGFSHPRGLLKSKLITKTQATDLERCFFEAADGMPKYINQLGAEICKSSLGEQYETSRKKISVPSAMTVSSNMIESNVRRTDRKIRTIIKIMKKSIEVRHTLRVIFNRGANKVHRISDLLSDIRKSEPEFKLEELHTALKKLSIEALYVQTGKDGEVIFARDPLTAHTLGLICCDPLRFNKDPNIFGMFGQQNLPLETI